MQGSTGQPPLRAETVGAMCLIPAALWGKLSALDDRSSVIQEDNLRGWGTGFDIEKSGNFIIAVSSGRFVDDWDSAGNDLEVLHPSG